MRLWIGRPVGEWLHGELAQRPEDEEGVLLVDVGKLGYVAGHVALDVGFARGEALLVGGEKKMLRTVIALEGLLFDFQ